MGADVHRFAIGQRSDLTTTAACAGQVDETGATYPAFRFVVLTLFAVDGVISAVGGAFLLPYYIGSVPFPISALISGLLNGALVWAAGRWTSSTRLAALPLWTWLLTVAVMGWGGPAHNVIYGGRSVLAYSPLWVLVAGVVPPYWVLLRRRIAR